MQKAPDEAVYSPPRCSSCQPCSQRLHSKFSKTSKVVIRLLWPWLFSLWDDVSDQIHSHMPLSIRALACLGLPCPLLLSWLGPVDIISSLGAGRGALSRVGHCPPQQHLPGSGGKVRGLPSPDQQPRHMEHRCRFKEEWMQVQGRSQPLGALLPAACLLVPPILPQLLLQG